MIRWWLFKVPLTHCFTRRRKRYRTFRKKELDGGDPEVDDNRALISTAIRACKTSGR